MLPVESGIVHVVISDPAETFAYTSPALIVCSSELRASSDWADRFRTKGRSSRDYYFCFCLFVPGFLSFWRGGGEETRMSADVESKSLVSL